MALLQSSSASLYLWHMARLQQRIQRKGLPGQHVVLTSAAWGRPWLCWRAEGCSFCRPPFLRCNTQQLPHICLPWNKRFPNSHRNSNRITFCPLYAAEALLSLLWYDIREPIAQLAQHRLSSDLTILNVRKFIHDLWCIKDVMMGKHITLSLWKTASCCFRCASMRLCWPGSRTGVSCGCEASLALPGTWCPRI